MNFVSKLETYFFIDPAEVGLQGGQCYKNRYGNDATVVMQRECKALHFNCVLSPCYRVFQIMSLPI